MSDIHALQVCRRIESSDSWRCIHFAEPVDRATFESFRDRGFHVATVPGTATRSKDELFDALASAFRFPSYFGRNWSALQECLEDMDEWLDASGYLLVIGDLGSDGLSAALARLFEMWPSVAQGWSADGTPCHIVALIEHYGTP